MNPLPKRGRGRPVGSTNKPKTDQGNDPVSNVFFGQGTTPNKSPSTNKPKREHIYTQLSHTSLGNTELYNLYGIVIDASCPHPKRAFSRQLLKIIDPTMHYKPNMQTAPNEQNNGCVSVTFFAHNAE